MKFPTFRKKVDSNMALTQEEIDAAIAAAEAAKLEAAKTDPDPTEPTEPTEPTGLFDGPYDEAKARLLIDKLREENRTLVKLGKSTPATEPTEPTTPTSTEPTEPAKPDLAMERILKLEADLLFERRKSTFAVEAESLGVNSAAVDMAFSEVADDLQYSDDGKIANLTTVIDSLKVRRAFLFAPKTAGQGAGGSANSGGATGGDSNTPLINPTDEAARIAFGKTPEEWQAAKAKVAANR